MDYNYYKEKFKNEYIFNITELTADEQENIPTNNKVDEYEYLKQNGYFYLNERYYKRVKIDVEDEQLLLFTQMKGIELLKSIQVELDELSEEKKKVEQLFRRLYMILLVLIIVVIIF